MLVTGARWRGPRTRGDMCSVAPESSMVSSSHVPSVVTYASFLPNTSTTCSARLVPGMISLGLFSNGASAMRISRLKRSGTGTCTIIGSLAFGVSAGDSAPLGQRFLHVSSVLCPVPESYCIFTLTDPYLGSYLMAEGLYFLSCGIAVEVLALGVTVRSFVLL